MESGECLLSSPSVLRRRISIGYVFRPDGFPITAIPAMAGIASWVVRSAFEVFSVEEGDELIPAIIRPRWGTAYAFANQKPIPVNGRS